jgi:S1-C subfamily serine protease
MKFLAFPLGKNLRFLLLSGRALPLLASSILAGSASAQDAVPAEAPAAPIRSASQELLSQKYEAIVRIENSTVVPDYAVPWNAGRDSGGSGTGFLISENRFLTNAHVVSDSELIYIKKVGDPKPYRATIVNIAHDCDLALLQLDDPSAFADVKPLEFGSVPGLDTVVKTIGYPIGGERISVTSGVVSRIDFLTYSHSSADLHLTIQIDAAINPGNSGGPVLQDGKVVGVAFQGYSGAQAQNTGYMIPTPVIERFLKDVEDGSYDHYVDLSVADFPLLNPAQRKALGLPNDGIGVMVSNADAGGSAGGALKVGDVLLEIDGYPIASNGLVNIHGETIDMNEIVERRFAGEKVNLKVWRAGKSFEVEVTLKRYEPYLISVQKYDVKPRFVEFAGLVFQPLDRNLMIAHNMEDPLVRYYFNYYATDELYKEHPEVIILTTILPDSINSQLEGFEHSIIESINGTPIKTLQDVSEAFEKLDPKTEFVVIKCIGQGRPIVIETARIADANKRIQSTYNVTKDHFLGDDAKAKKENGEEQKKEATPEESKS